MSVMNRKMFSNRDARTKLAGMGGILASSPELMGAAQRFQTGGQGVPRPGTGYGNEIFGEGNIFSSGAGAASGGDMVILGNTVFYLVDNGTVIDREGNVIRDPSIVQAVIQKVSGEQPSQAQLAQQGTQDRVNIAQQVMAQPPAPAVDGGGGIADLMRSLMTPVAETIRGPVQDLGEVIEGPVQDLGASMQQSMEPLQNAIAAGRVDPTALVTPEIVDDVQELPAAEGGFSLNNTLRSIFEPVGDMASEVFSPVGDLMEDNELRSAIRLGREQKAAAAIEAQRIAEAERANAALNTEEAASRPMIVERSTAADPFGPEALAARAAMQEQENQERLSIDAKLDTRAAAAAAQEEAAAQLSADRLAASAGFVGEDEPTTTDYSTINDPGLERLLSLDPRNPNPDIINEILMRSTPRIESTTGIDSDYGADLSPDMVAELNRLEDRRISRGIAGAGGGFLDSLLEGANVTGGVAYDQALKLAAGTNKAMGYVTGGGGVSDFFFKQAQAGQRVRDRLTGNGENILPRLFPESTQEGPTVEAAAQLERDKIENDSILASTAAELRSDPSLFAEGSVVEQLPFLNGQSILDARNAELAAEEFAQRPDTQDPLTDDKRARIITAALGLDPSASTSEVVTPISVKDGASTSEVVTPAAATETGSFANLIQQATDLGSTVANNVMEFFKDKVGPSAEAVAEAFNAENDTNPLPANASAGEYRNFLDRVLTRFKEGYDAYKDRKDATTVEVTPNGTETDGTETDGAGTVEVTPVEVVPAGAAPAGAETVEVVAPKIDPAIVTKIAKNPNKAVETVTVDLLGGLGIDATNMSFKERSVAMKKALSDLMGKTDADKKEEFWMNMAMMGFAVAAGDSPDALKNIADGMLAGSAQVQKGKAADRERDDKLSLTAVGEVLDADKAARKYVRDLKIAGVRANKDSIYTPERERSLLKIEILKDPTYYLGSIGYPKGHSNAGQIDTNALKLFLDRMVPGSGTPDPAYVNRIAELRKKGLTDDVIRANLVEKNLDPTIYGL